MNDIYRRFPSLAELFRVNALDDSKQANYSTYNPYMVETFVIHKPYSFRRFPL
jgi:hypothetical protein